MDKRKFFSTLLSLTLTFALNAQILNDSQLIPGDHEVYDLFYELCTESGIVSLADIAPVSAAELKFYLKDIDKEKLSESGFAIYKRVYEFLYPYETEEEKPDGFLYDFDLSLTPELYWKTNENTDWSFSKYLEDYPVKLPVKLGVSDHLYIDGDFFLGKNAFHAALPTSFTNVPVSATDIDNLFPNYANINGAFSFDNFGFNIQMGRSDLTLGKTLTGSLIYNSTFETNAYITAGIWTRNVRITLTFAQVDYKRYINMHQFQVKVLPNLKLGALEGQLIYGDPELRFFNPLMVMHNFFPGNDFINIIDGANSFYDVNYCAYLGLFADYVPVNNIRLYFLFAMNEMQLPSELESNYGRLLPDSFGIQTGADAYFQAPGGGKWKLKVEGVYTTPFLYIKQDPRWSMLRQRYDSILYAHTGQISIDSWIGTPFGPDSIAADIQFSYDKSGEYSCGIEYLMKMKGEIDFDTFKEDKVQGKRFSAENDYSGKYFCNYYPSVRYYYTGTDSFEESEALARAHLPTGIIETTHRVSLTGSYIFNKGIKVTGKTSYIFVLNSNHESGNFQQGVEFAIAAKFSFF